MIDRYKVEALLGSGGTAVVYRVRHRQLNTLHALKVLSITSASIRERMIREGQVQATLRHLNVVAVTDVLDIDGAPGLLLEYIEGPTLEDALRRYRLSLEDAETLFLGVLSGVRHAHQHGLVHRDLKPANVLLAKTPEGFVPKVTDFGLAKVLQTEGEATGQTRNGIAMGTPHYMAPEQIRDARNVDQRADVFSLGCLLYELCTGERTFPGDNALAIYNAVCAGDFVPARDIVPDLPERLDVAIRGALLLDPNKRIPDCETLLAVMKGERAWAAPVAGASPAKAPASARGPSLPPEDRTEVIPLAARGEDGGTPAPAPSRSAGPRGASGRARSTGGGLGVEVAAAEARPSVLDSSEVSLSRRRPAAAAPVEGTLGADDSFERRGSPAGVILAIAVGLFVIVSGGAGAIALAAALFFGTGAPPAPVRATPVASTAVEASGEPVEGAAVAEPPPAEIAPAAAPPLVPAPKLAPVDDSPVPIRTTARNKPVQAAAPEPAAAAGVVSIVKILSVPPTASVRIDGSGHTPTPLKTDLPTGKHEIEVRSGEQVGRFTIDVIGGIENKWCYAFDEERLHPGSCPR